MYWNLIHKFLSGQCTEEERQKVEQWLHEDQRHQKFLNDMQKIWEVEPSEKRDVDVKKAWQRFRSERMSYGPQKVKNFRRTAGLKSERKQWYQKEPLRAAAAVIFMLVAIFFVIRRPWEGSPKITYQQVVTKKGEKNSLKLSDGTRVKLNAESTLKIPSNYGKDTRKLYLVKGEAFFDVKHEPLKPFSVYAEGIYTKDIGTKFNISVSPVDSTLTVVVSKGKVELGNIESNNKKSVLLSSKDRAVIPKGEIPEVQEVSDLSSYLGWTQGNLIFDNISLTKVKNKLERWYGVECIIKNKELLNRKLTATFEDEPLSNVLKLISVSMNIDAHIKGEKAIFDIHQSKSHKQ